MMRNLDRLWPAGSVSLQARRVVEEASRILRYRPGDFLWHVGDMPLGLYVLVEGRVRIVRERAGRAVMIHAVASAGEVFGDVPFFAGAGYPASAIAESDVTCHLISIDSVRRAAAIDPMIMELLLRGLARRVVTLIDRVEENSLVSVRVRLARHLRSHLTDSNGEQIIVIGSQQALAEKLGTVREVVAREIARFKTEGIVESRGRGIVAIPDPRRLARVV